MSWFPTFLNPLAAAIAAAIAIPALLVLYFLKLRRREMPIPTTLLWKKAIQDLQVNAPFQRLRRNLLLFLQMALLMLLILALARPVTFFTPGAGKNTVIIIDRSASMSATDVNGKTRLDEAKRRAKDLVETLDRGDAAMVIAFDEKAMIVQETTGDTMALKTAIDSITPTDRRSRLKTAYQLADAKLAFIAEQLRPGSGVVLPDVFVYSDGRVLDASELSIKGKLTYEKIGSADAGNIAVVSLSAKRNYERPTEVQIFARLANFGTKVEKADVELSVSPIDPADPAKDDFKVRGLAAVTLPPERWTDKEREAAAQGGTQVRDSVEFTLDLTTAAVIRVEHKNKTADALPADDAAFVALPPPRALGVLLVTDGNYYLERAIQSLNLKDPKSMTPGEYEQKRPGDFDVIIFDRYAPKQSPPSGNFVYFGALPEDLKLKAAKDNGQTVVLTEVGILDWKRDHPLLRHLSLAKLYAAEAIKLDVPLDSDVLIEGMKGPLVVLHREGRGVHLVVAFDLMQSNWPLRISFPIFLHNALQFMALGSDMDVRQSYQPGATPTIPRANLQRAAGEGGQLQRVRLSGPVRSRDVEVPETGDFALPPLDFVGVYRTDPVIPQYERVVVNLLDPNESNLVPADAPPGNIGEPGQSGSGKSRLELWWWIVACAALPLLMIEWWVYTRRVHL